MNHVLILKEKINNNIEFNYNDKYTYTYTYGILVPLEGKPEKVMLSVTKKQAAYLESLFLHDY